MEIVRDFSRRAFLGSIGAISVSGILPAQARAAGEQSIEYVGSRDSIGVFHRAHGCRRQTQIVTSQRPSFLALDPSRKVLFAVNAIDEFEGLPTGSVESYGTQAGNGHLTLISRRSLSLSATVPRHLAISPDRQHLVVAVYGGGAYNVLPVYANGELGPVSQIVKEIGSGAHPEKQAGAHPHSVIFAPSGKFVVGTDVGSDRINVFRFEAGRMTRVHQISVRAGSGPAELAMNPAGSLLFVRHEFNLLHSYYRFDARTGAVTYLTSRLADGRCEIDKRDDRVL